MEFLFVTESQIKFSLPINYALFVQKSQTRNDFRGVELGAWLRKTATDLNVEHQIAAV